MACSKTGIVIPDYHLLRPARRTFARSFLTCYTASSTCVAVGVDAGPARQHCWLKNRALIKATPGTYGLVLRCSTTRVIRIGCIGILRLDPGWLPVYRQRVRFWRAASLPVLVTMHRKSGMWSKHSCGRGCGTGISRQDVLDSGCHVAHGRKPSRGREEQHAVLAWMVALCVTMLWELGERFPQRTFPEPDQREEALFFNRSHPALRKSVPVGAAPRKSQTLYAPCSKGLAEFSAVPHGLSATT
jgi:hypothetical protein